MEDTRWDDSEAVSCDIELTVARKTSEKLRVGFHCGANRVNIEDK